MNIHKLEDVLPEMQFADFQDLTRALPQVRQGAERISIAISEQLLTELGVSPGDLLPALSHAYVGAGIGDSVRTDTSSAARFTHGLVSAPHPKGGRRYCVGASVGCQAVTASRCVPA